MEAVLGWGHLYTVHFGNVRRKHRLARLRNIMREEAERGGHIYTNSMHATVMYNKVLALLFTSLYYRAVQSVNYSLHLQLVHVDACTFLNGTNTVVFCQTV